MSQIGECVADASAVLALLNREPGHEQLQDLLKEGRISAVNLAEVAAKLMENGFEEEEAADDLSALGLFVVPFGAELAFRTAALRSPTRKLGLSLADRACLATALELNLPVLTTDRIWSKLKLDIQVHVIR